MIGLATDSLFQLPSVQQFLRTMIDDIVARRSLLVIVPEGVDGNKLWELLCAGLHQRSFWVEPMSLRLPQGRTPITALCETLGVERIAPERPWTIDHLYEAAEGLPDVIYLDGLDALGEDGRRNWLMLLRQWAEYSQGMASTDRQPAVLCAVVPATALLCNIPETNVYLSVRWWWMLPSVLETHLLCRVQTTDSGNEITARWREHTLPALAGSDITLIDDLWTGEDLGVATLTERLKQFAEERGWSARLLHELGRTDLQLEGGRDDSLTPPPAYRELWARGIISATPEYGIELHSAALALLGRTEELRHRFWRGQARTLLPLIDHIRLHICTQFNKTYGNDWPIRWNPPLSSEEAVAVRESAFACQWGHLEWLLQNCRHLRAEHRWLPLVSLCRWTRNEVAHYRPISYRDFEGLCREIERTLRWKLRAFA